MAKHVNEGHVSAAFFCPQTTAADEGYLASLHGFLKQNGHGQKLLEHVAALADRQLWETFASSREDVRELSHGPKCLAALHDWAKNGVSGPLAAIRANITSLPLLAILQVGQYLRYLEVHSISHKQFVENVKQGGGGVHGYCGGLPAAISIACADNEAEMIEYLATAMRVLVGIGAYTEAADEDKGAERTLLAVRLKYDEQAEEFTRRFPGTYISGITGPRSISIGGPAAKVRELYKFVTENEGLRAQKIDLGGSAHNPANADLAAELCQLCRDTPGLQLPDASELRIPSRSNQQGERLTKGSLTDDLVYTMLAARCEWLCLLENVARDLRKSSRTTHNVVIFGWADCVSMAPFFQERLQINKMFAKSLIEEHMAAHPSEVPTHTQPEVSKKVDAAVSLEDFPDHAIAVVGASCRLPGANDMEELWNIISQGANTVQELSTDRFNLQESFRGRQSGTLTQGRKFYGNFIEDVKRFDHAFFGVSAREAVNLDPQHRVMLELSFEALEDAGYLASHERMSGDEVGCFIGLVLAEYMDNTNGHAATAYTSTGTVPAFLCGRISHFYGWTGPSEMFNTACSSSMVAINRACKALQLGECRMAVAGGVNVMTGVNNYLDLAKAGFLSPSGQCKPFDASADGYCRAEGAGLVVLKKLKDAIACGDGIWGIIPGIATNQGGLSASLTIPHPAAQQSLYQKVLSQAGLRGDQVTYVEAHGTGTQVGDPLEMESIRSVFGNASRQNIVHVGSIKANVGHSEPAAGVAGLLKVLAMLHHAQIPPQADYRQLNPKIPALEPDRMAISRTLKEWDIPVRAALVNSYGAAGSNGALVCCDVPDRGHKASDDKTRNEGLAADMIFPLLVTAASKTSVIDTAHTIGRYLERKAGLSSMQLIDVAYTLNQKRKRQRYFTSIKAKSIAEAGRLLRNLGASDVSEFLAVSEPSKPVVLAFSGQTSSTIALPRTIYDDYSRFRFHLDACDAEFRRLGHSSLLATIFQKVPVENIAALQCGIFSVQYACANSWIDAGIQPRAVIGHSLGELTAYVVSGVLSLADGIKLIASRGHLIETKWGPEKGTMLALECTINEFEMLSALVRQESEGHMNGCPALHLEIACFNGPMSLVTAGPTHAISRAEAILRTQPRFQRIRHQRLKTSHGFHSGLVEPLLDELTTIARTLNWNEPTIPVYTCTVDDKTSNGLVSTYSQDVASHARKPVFFANAVSKIEAALGPALWLEAGFDSPIMAMVRRTCRAPELNWFQPVKTVGQANPSGVIADVVGSLWHSGRIFVSHWGFFNDDGSAFYVTHPDRKAWLPPYQFAKTQHWVDNVDRAAEAQRLLEESKLASGSPVKIGSMMPPSPPPLITRVRKVDLMPGSSEFLLNTQNPRYKEVVRGHVVCSQPLCPAPMYMELATMALHQVLGGSHDANSVETVYKGKSLIFEELHVSSPLGIEPSGSVTLRLDEVSSRHQAWKLTISSMSPTGGKTSHVDAIIALTAEHLLDGFQRLIAGQAQRLLDSTEAEKLQCSRAYKLFARVVTYGDFFKGIETIKMEEHEAVATVLLPPGQPHRDENKAWRICDAITLDTCIHVIGLLINTSSSMASDDVAVMVGLDRAIISPAFTMEDTSRWTVFASFSSAGDQQHPVGDAFVCSQQGELVAMFTGCCMTRLPVARLEKILGAASKNSAGPRSQTTLPSNLTNTIVTEQNAATIMRDKDQQAHKRTPGKSLGSMKEKTGLALKELISECTLIDVSSIPEDTALGLIGLDSLGAAELAEELCAKFHFDINSVSLLESTVLDLLNLLGSTDNHVETDSVLLTNEHDAVRDDAPQLTAVDAKKSDQVKREALFNLFSEVSGTTIEDLEPRTTLIELGIDSLSLIDLKEEIETHFSLQLDMNTETTLGIIMEHLELPLQVAAASVSDPLQANINLRPPKIGSITASAIQTNPFKVLRSLITRFDEASKSNGVANYWSDIAPFQDELTLAYIVEGFAGVGVDLRHLSPGEETPLIPYLSPKYDKLVRRLWETLQKRGVVSISEAGPEGKPLVAGTIRRGSREIDRRPASQLLQEFDQKFPSFFHETQLIGLVGPRLADCLSGRIDSVSLMFGSSQALKTMENYYGNSPISATLTEQLCIFLSDLMRTKTHIGSERPVRILEVGGGTGGTTRWLAEALDRAGIETQYTFTDISPSLVKKAKSKFQQLYPWISYTTFNLEEEVRPEFREQYDIALATNTVHATTDRIASCRRLRETLHPGGGLLLLAELTCHIDWSDICFGLLDGWWLADGPIAPLQTAEEWMTTFTRAGFASMGYSTGSRPKASTAQLLVACNTYWESPGVLLPVPTTNGNGFNGQRVEHEEKGDHRLETMLYKDVDGVQIHADVYYPKSPSSSPMPIVLMIHGGGHVTLSRRAIRPAQTRYLIKHGLVPVSIDYRLCPEVSLMEGPIADVRDAYRWVRNMLPQIASEAGYRLDPTRVAVVGWSTGGHLAMSLGWTAGTANVPQPNAILSFYGPVDFESRELDDARFLNFRKSQKTMDQIIKALPDKPVTHSSSTGDTSDLGWVRDGDARSDLLLAISQQGIALPVLLNGLDYASSPPHPKLNLKPPTPEHIASISPLAQLRAGQYSVPTFIAHSIQDDVAPFPAAERFVAEMRLQGLSHGFLPVEGGQHIFDLGVEEGSKKWESLVAPGYHFIFEALNII